jgi:hypothetical protein
MKQLLKSIPQLANKDARKELVILRVRKYIKITRMLPKKAGRNLKAKIGTSVLNFSPIFLKSVSGLSFPLTTKVIKSFAKGGWLSKKFFPFR